MVNMNRSLPILQVKYDGVTTEEIAKGNFGTLTYINNKVEVGEFDIKTSCSS